MEKEIINSVVWISHEESYSDGRTLGVLVNYDLDRNMEKIDSFIYLFREESKTYVFFESIVDMNDYILYGDKRVKKAYLKEDDFDKIIDNDLRGKLNNILKWIE